MKRFSHKINDMHVSNDGHHVHLGQNYRLGTMRPARVIDTTKSLNDNLMMPLIC